MVIAELSFSLQGNVLILSFLLLVALVLAGLFYRYTLPALPYARRLTFSILRSLSLCLLILLLFEPVMHRVQRDEIAPTVAVLIDDSQSLTLAGQGGTRGDAVRNFLGKEPFQSIPSPAEVKQYAFSSSLPKEPIPSPDSLRFDGETTDLSQVMAQVKSRLINENIQAVVLLTDGNMTVGKNPLYDAEELGIPVYTIGVGDTIEQQDVLVEKVLTNDIVYADSKVPVDVTIKSSGYGGENVEVVLREGSTIVDRVVVTLENGTREYPIRLTMEPHVEGIMKYTVGVSELPGEFTTKNNTQNIFVKVLKSKLQVLLLAGAPNPDVPALRQALLDDRHFTVRARIQKKTQDFYEGTLTAEMLDSADCLILVGFPSGSTPSNVLQDVRNSIERGRKPVFFLNAKTTDYQKLAVIEPFLPFSWSNPAVSEFTVSAVVPERQKTHTLIRLDGSVTPEAWQQLPPVYKSQTTFQSKPEAELLAAVRLMNVVLPELLVAIRNVNRMKSFAITGYGIWRWQLLSDQTTSQSGFYRLLVSDAVRWLTTKDEGKNVRIAPTKDMFTTAEPIQLTAQVYDEQLRTVDDAEVTVALHRGNETREVELDATGNGLYEGAIEDFGEGDYTYEGTALAGGTKLGEDKGKFTVGQMNVEYLETRLNKPLLEQIAYRTHARYVPLDAAQDIAQDLQSSVRLQPKEVVQTSELELWNWYYLAGSIILLLAIEWFLRKRSGMI